MTEIILQYPFINTICQGYLIITGIMGIFISSDVIKRRVPKEYQLYGLITMIFLAITLPLLYSFVGAYGIALETTNFDKIRKNRK